MSINGCENTNCAVMVPHVGGGAYVERNSHAERGLTGDGRGSHAAWRTTGVFDVRRRPSIIF